MRLATDPRIEVSIIPESDARNRLRTAKTDLVLKLAVNGQPDQYLLDPNRPESVLARNAVDNARLKALSSLPPSVEETMSEPGSRYIDFLIPGLLGTNLMGGGLFGVVDLASYVSGQPLAIKTDFARKESRLVALNSALEVNCALLIDRLAGLRNQAAFKDFAEKATEAADKDWDEKNYQAETFKKEHMRTPYKQPHFKA